MAFRFHSSVSLLCHTSCLSPAPLPATTTHLKLRKSCLMSPHLKHCSRGEHWCASSLRLENTVPPVQLPADEFDESELPPLVASLAIPGLPPCRESGYADEACAHIMKHWSYNWLDSNIFQTCVAWASFVHPSTVSCDSLGIVSSIYLLVLFVDDIMFDGQNDILREKSGIDLSRSPDRIREYLHSLNGVLRQELPLPNPTPIQELTWKLGRDVREVSNPEWFSDFADAVLDYFDSSLESYSADVEGEGHCKYVMDLDSYTRMRLRNTGGSLCNICVELSNNVLLSAEIREHPVVQQLTKCLWYYNAYLNDIYSYSKEQDEPHSRNLIMVFMRSESMSLPEAAWKAVNLTNAIARDFMELETHLPVWEDEQKAYVLHRYVQGMKEFMSGTLYFHSLSKRYRLREAPFPELRDVNIPVRAKAEHFKGV